MSATVKLDRAERAMRKAIAAANQWVATVPHNMAVEIEEAPDGRLDAVVRLVTIPAAPTEVSLALDEYFHHARSALDHAVWQLVLDSGNKPDRQAFPVTKTDTPASSKQITLYTKHLNPAAITVVRDVQPYNHRFQAREDGITVDQSRAHRYSFLWQLHQLDIVCKHRTVLPTVSVHTQVRLDWVTTDEEVGVPASYQLRNADQPGAFENGFVFAKHDVPRSFVMRPPNEWIHVEEVEPAIERADDYAPLMLASLPQLLLLVRDILARLQATRSS